MSSLDLVGFAANENHVKFRSTLNEMLYSRLSEAVKEKTKDMVAEIFETERVEESASLTEYVSAVIHAAEEELGTEFSTEEITESTSHIISLLEKKMKKDKEEEEEEEEEEKDEEEEEKDEEEEEEEEEEDEEEVEDKQEKEEDKDEKKAGKKAKQVFHFDINSHKKG